MIRESKLTSAQSVPVAFFLDVLREIGPFPLPLGTFVLGPIWPPVSGFARTPRGLRGGT